LEKAESEGKESGKKRKEKVVEGFRRVCIPL
jgi:hypothetical protein